MPLFSYFFFSSTRLYSFYCSPFPIFSLLRGLEAAFRSCAIKVYMGNLTQIIDTVFTNKSRHTDPPIDDKQETIKM